MTPPAPARLFVFLAREADSAIIVRRGPTRVMATVGWDRTDDTFKIGQWLRGRIDIERSDLSPDGHHFLYSALKFDPSLGYKATYTVLSRAPYLKALHYWAPQHYIWGGAFLSNEEFWIYRFGTSAPEVCVLPSFAPAQDTSSLNSGKWGSHMIIDFRRKRDGWRLGDGTFQHRQLWFKTLDDWTLSHSIYNWAGKPDAYALKHGETEIIGSAAWNWADFDAPRRRLCFARDGQLWALDLKEGAQEEMLHDFNAWQFEPLIAPY